MNNDATLWLGSQQSYEIYADAMARARARFDADVKTGARGYDDEPEDRERMSHLLQIQGNVAILTIAGPLVDGHAGYMRYYGVTGYLDIRDALAQALTNASVGSILLYTASGGGHVAGCHETAQLIQRINKVKPVVTYNGSNMGSACTWLGASAREIFVAETAQSGSIGIIMVHASREKQLRDDGIKVTVIRAGSEKALASAYEDLTAKAQEILQGQANALYDIFIGHIADCRGMAVAAADKQFGQGREFLGKQAVEAGLADKVGAFEDAYARASVLAEKVLKKASAPSSPTVRSFGATNNAAVPVLAGAVGAVTPDNPPIAQGNNMPEPLNQEQIAAMAAGVDLNAADATTAPAMEAATGDKPSAPATGAAPVANPATNVSADALSIVQGMLSTAQTELVTARAEAVAAKAQVEATKAEVVAAKAAMAPFVEIARASVKTMGLHFGLSAEAVSALTPEQVLSEQHRLAKAFQEKFKAGGVAATTAKDTEDKKTESAVPAMFAVLTKNHAK